MGGTTFLSLNQPLKDRTNIVLSRSEGFLAEGVTICHSMEEALKLVQQQTAFVIGGAQVFAQALPHATHLYLTRIHATFEADSFFPEYDPAVWKLYYQKDQLSESGIMLTFEKHHRFR